MKTEVIEPNAYIAIRLPSETHSIIQVKPNTTIHIGKYGSFQANQIIGRPYYLTFEILNQGTENVPPKCGLRIVPASELHAGNLEDNVPTPSESRELQQSRDGVQYDVLGDDGLVLMRTNQHTIDDPASQVMTMEDIEKLKAASTGSGQELVAKILESHSALDQKTAFALAKYTLRKTKKYLKRFTVLPLDVALLAKWILLEKDAGKIMDMREELMALIRSWSNVHFAPQIGSEGPEETAREGGGRWLVVEETAGLLTAYMAEQLGLLHMPAGYHHDLEADESSYPAAPSSVAIPPGALTEPPAPRYPAGSFSMRMPSPETPSHHLRHPPASDTNTLTIIHPLSQPNLSLLRYFHFDVFNPLPSHPLTTHLRTLSWLQLLDPSADSAYQPPPTVLEAELATYKPAKRGNYFRKLRRWERTKLVVDSTRAGGFDGLVVASVMKTTSVLHHLIPLLRGSAQVVVYSPHLEPLAELADYYSTARKTAFLNNPVAVPTEDFPVDPRLLLAPTVQTVRAKGWQVLPGRTHPLMTGKGGCEGFVFTGTRVLPGEGITARGNYGRRGKRKGEGATNGEGKGKSGGNEQGEEMIAEEP